MPEFLREIVLMATVGGSEDDETARNIGGSAYLTPVVLLLIALVFGYPTACEVLGFRESVFGY